MSVDPLAGYFSYSGILITFLVKLSSFERNYVDWFTINGSNCPEGHRDHSIPVHQLTPKPNLT